MKKTRKLLSLFLAVLTLMGCLAISSLAGDSVPAFLDEASYTVRGAGKISSIEIRIDDEFTVYNEKDCGIDIYYSAEPYEGKITAYNIYYKLEKVGYAGSSKMYFKDNVLHADLSNQKLTKEGYYYFVLSSGAFSYSVDRDSIRFYNPETVFGPEHYRYASLGFGAKLSAFFDYLGSVFTNIFTNGRVY